LMNGNNGYWRVSNTATGDRISGRHPLASDPVGKLAWAWGRHKI
jgi:hypothetical protein